MLLTKCSADRIERNEMGGACSTYGGRREFHIGFWWGDLKKRRHFKGLGINGGKNVKRDIKNRIGLGVD